MMIATKRRYPIRYVLIALPIVLIIVFSNYAPSPSAPSIETTSVDTAPVDTTSIDSSNGDTTSHKNILHTEQTNSEDAKYLPPRLAIITGHHARPRQLPTDRPEWKRPRVLTAHAIRVPDKSTLNLAIFTTGTDTQSYGRTFTPVACKLGDKVFRTSMVRPEVTICEVDEPIDGEIVTVLLRLDDTLTKAMTEKQILSREQFEILPGDVIPLSNVTVPGEHSEVAAVASDLRWSQHLVDVNDKALPRHELCMMTAMKQYPYLLDGYAEYYRRAGADQIFIYDNFAETDIAGYMSKYDFVQVIFWPFTRSQMQSFTHFLRASKSRCKYVAFFDADEYIMIGPSGANALKKYIYHRMRTQKYKQVVSHFLRFLNNGYVRRPEGALPELYTRREKDQRVTLGKAIIDTDHRFNFHKIHMVEGVGTKTYWNTTLELDPMSYDHNAMLMHYTDRSWEENVLKKKFGGSSPMTSYRKPEELDVNRPDKAYMDKSKTVAYDGFVKRYQAVMRDERPKWETVVWKEGDRLCTRQYCASCGSKRLSANDCRNLD